MTISAAFANTWRDEKGRFADKGYVAADGGIVDIDDLDGEIVEKSTIAELVEAYDLYDNQYGPVKMSDGASLYALPVEGHQVRYVALLEEEDGTSLEIYDDFYDVAYDIDISAQESDVHDAFLSQAKRTIVFHGTRDQDSFDSIKEGGIGTRNETRAPGANTSVGSAVFTTSNENVAYQYGADTFVFEIDLPQAIADGVITTDNLSREPGINEAEVLSGIAYGYDDDYYNAYDGFSGAGIDEATIIISTDIPPKYLKPYGNAESLTVQGSVSLGNEWRDEIGRFAPKGYTAVSSGVLIADAETLLQARNKAQAMMSAAPQPPQTAVIAHQADALLAREGWIRAGGERRGNSTRRAERLQEMADLWGDGEVMPCVHTGVMLAGNKEAALKYGLEMAQQDKLIVGPHGGGYTIDNLVPSSRAANQSRGDDTPVWLGQPEWGDPAAYASVTSTANSREIALQFQKRRKAIRSRRRDKGKSVSAPKGKLWDTKWRGEEFEPAGPQPEVSGGGDGGGVDTDVVDKYGFVGGAVDGQGGDRSGDWGRVDDVGVVGGFGVSEGHDSLVGKRSVPSERFAGGGCSVGEVHGGHDSSLGVRRAVQFANTWRDEIGRFARKGYAFVGSTGTDMTREVSAPKSEAHDRAANAIQMWGAALQAQGKDVANTRMPHVIKTMKAIQDEDPETFEEIRDTMKWLNDNNGIGAGPLVDEMVDKLRPVVLEEFTVREPYDVTVGQEGSMWFVEGRTDLKLEALGKRSINEAQAKEILAAAVEAKAAGNIRQQVTIKQRTEADALQVTGNSDTGGWVSNRDPNTINIVNKAFGAGSVFAHNKKSDRMATSNLVDDLRWITMHEMGHVSFFLEAHRNGGAGPIRAANARNVVPAARYHNTPWMSDYGKSSSMEAHAEAFAEWTSTGGKTSNRAVHDFQQEWGWSDPGSVDLGSPSGTLTAQAITFAIEDEGDDLILVETGERGYAIDPATKEEIQLDPDGRTDGDSGQLAISGSVQFANEWRDEKGRFAEKGYQANPKPGDHIYPGTAGAVTAEANEAARQGIPVPEFDGNDDIYRGIALPVTDAEMAEINSLLQPAMTLDEVNQELYIGPMLVQKALGYEGHQGDSETSGLGRHWTTDPEMAASVRTGDAQQILTRLKSRPRQSDIRAQEVVENGQKKIVDGNGNKADKPVWTGWSSGESEVLLEPNSPVDIVGVEILVGNSWRQVWGDIDGNGVGDHGYSARFTMSGGVELSLGGEVTDTHDDPYVDPVLANRMARLWTEAYATFANTMSIELAAKHAPLSSPLTASASSPMSWSAIVDEILADGLGDAFYDALVGVNVEIGFDIRDAVVERTVSDIIEHVRAFEPSIRKSTTKWLQKSLRDGLSVDAAVAALPTDSPLSPRQAYLTARTELIAASNNGAYLGYLEAGVKSKTWITARDDRVRHPTHTDMEGKKVDLRTDFLVDGFAASYPGDPRLPIKERIQCRCTIVPSFEPNGKKAITKKELYAQAVKREIPGRSRMNKPQLQQALAADVALDVATMAQLHIISRARNIVGRYGMRKAELLAAIRAS